MKASPTNTTTPTFPDSVITGLSKEFVDIFTPTTESPREFLWSAFVTAFGALMSPYVERGNGTQAQPRLYTCNIGPSGFGRKSTAAKRAVEVIRGAVDPTDLTFVDGFGSSEGILRAIISAPSNASTKVCVIYLDELEVLFRKAKVSGTAGVVPLQVLYESNSYSNVVQQNSVVITDAHLAMLANSTTDRFSDLWTADDVASGFLSRWTLVYGEPTTRLPNPPLPDQVRLDALTEKLRGFHREGPNGSSSSHRREDSSSLCWHPCGAALGQVLHGRDQDRRSCLQSDRRNRRTIDGHPHPPPRRPRDPCQNSSCGD